MTEFRTLTADQKTTVENSVYGPDQLQDVKFKTIDAPHNTVFQEERNRTLSLPQTLNETETDFIIKRDADEVKNFFAMEDTGGFEALGKGLESFVVAQPQAFAGLVKEQAELSKGEARKPKGMWGLSETIKYSMDLARNSIFQNLGTDEVINKMDGIIARNKKYIADAGLTRPEEGGLSGLMYDLGQGGGSLFASLGLAALTRSPSTAGLYFGAMQKSSVYQEARAAGKTPEQASGVSTLAGVVEGGLEFIGLDHFMKAIKGNSAVKRFISGFAIEAVQEGSQAAGEELITQTYGTREKPISQTASDILYQAVLGGVIGGGANATIGAFVKDKAIEQGIDEKTATQMGEYAEKNIDAAKTNLGEFIDKELAPIARDEKSAQEFITLMQKFGNDQTLVEPDSLDPQTRQVFDQYIDMFNNSKRDEVSISEVEKKFYDQAISAGIDEDQAVAASKLIGARADAAARALGITPKEWLESKNITLQKEGVVPEGDTFNQDLDFDVNQKDMGSDDYKVFSLSKDGKDLGETSVSRNRNGVTLESVFIEKNMRGSGFGNKALDFQIDQAFDIAGSSKYIFTDVANKRIFDMLSKRLGKPEYISTVTKEIDQSEISDHIPENPDPNSDEITGAGVSVRWSLKKAQREYNKYKNTLRQDARGSTFNQNGKLKTETPQFKNWFGDSKVVDKEGNPQVVYHGTDKMFSRVNMKKGAQGLFWFTSDKSSIERGEVGASGKGKIIEMYASIKNPAGWKEYDKFGIGELIARGYDGAILPDGDGSFTGFIFEPNQVKSVKNKGEFDPNNPNMLKQDARGSITFTNEGAIINLFKTANPSTLFHELGHLFLRDMADVAAKTKRPMVRKDFQTVKKWLGATGNKFTRAQEEKFARGFEAYLREGKAPKPELQGIFDRFKQWLESVYDSVKRLNVELSPEVRQAFDRMLGGDFAQQETLLQEDARAKIERDYETISQQDDEKTLLSDTGKVFRSASELGANLFVPISTRLGNMDQTLKHEVRKYVYNMGIYAHEDRQTIKPFVEKVSNDMSVEDFRVLDLALKNRDIEKVDFLVDKYKMQKEWKAVKQMLDDLYIEAEDAGINVSYIQDYFPRKVKSGMAAEYMAALRNQQVWSEVELALKKADPAGTFSDQDKAEFVNGFLRGFSNNQIKMSKTGFTKERTVDYVEPQFNKYYENSMDALMQYVGGIRHGIETYKLFGIASDENKQLRRNARNIAKELRELETSEIDDNTDIDEREAKIGKLYARLKNAREKASLDEENNQKLDDSIGQYVRMLIDEGTITADQEKELVQMLRAVVNPTGTHGVVAWAKNASYVYLMGNPLSAITQIQDLAFSLWKNGYFRTPVSVIKAISGNSVLKKEDLGIDNILQEFESETRASSAVRAVFKAIGLTAMDNLGKNTYIDAAYGRLRAQSKKNSKEFNQYLDDIFGDEANDVKADLKNGTISENVKYLLFSELSDTQPISLAEMPVGYLRGGNGRVFYMLKTYTLRQIDIYRREVFSNIFSTDPKKIGKGLGNLISLASALMLMGMSSDALKDLILGRDFDLSELVVDNMLKVMGLTKYQIYKSKQEGIIRTFWTWLFIPPIGTPIDDAARDFSEIVIGKEDKRTGEINYKDPKDARVLGNIPLVGKFYYWWWGGGRAQEEKANKSKVSSP